MKKILVIVAVSFALIMLIILGSYIGSNRFKLEGTWQNIGETSYGHICPGNYLNISKGRCDIAGENNTYKLKRINLKEYHMTVSNLPYDSEGKIVFHIYIKDKDNIIIRHRWCEIQMKRVETEEVRK